MLRDCPQLSKPTDIALRFYVVLCMTVKGAREEDLDSVFWGAVGYNAGFKKGLFDNFVDEVHRALSTHLSPYYWEENARHVFPQVTKLILGDEDEPSIESKAATTASNGTSPGQGVQSA